MKAKNTPPPASMKVRADCGSLTSRAGTALLVGVADRVGLTDALKGVFSDLRIRRGRHQPGQVLRDLAVMLTDSGNALCDLDALRDQEVLFGAVTSEAIGRLASHLLRGRGAPGESARSPGEGTPAGVGTRRAAEAPALPALPRCREDRLPRPAPHLTSAAKLALGG